MATVVNTISEEELDFRVEQASFALYDGKRVSLAPGFFRASGITPKQLMNMLLSHLHCQELEWIQYEYGIECSTVMPRQWRVYIDRKPENLSFVVRAVAKD